MSDEWKDISIESQRTYTFPGGDTVTIKNPLELKVSESGGHRIKAADLNYYIPPGWICLSFDGGYVI